MILYRGYKKEHYENVKNNIKEERSTEKVGSFDDLVWKSNEWNGERSYECNEEVFTNWLQDVLGVAYTVKGDIIEAHGVNACTELEQITQFYACPDADIIIKFEGRILSENLGGDGVVAVIDEVLEIIEL